MIIGYTIISRANYKCNWCEKASALIDNKGLPYRLRKLKLSDLTTELDRASMNTIPIIYHGVNLIGGYDDLVKYLEVIDE